MTPVDFIIVAVIAVILAGAGFYIYKAKKNGQKCVGCPHAKTCAHAQNGSCQCEK